MSSSRCRDQFYAGGEPLLERAQQARLVRSDTNITDVVQLVGGHRQDPVRRAGADRTGSSTWPSTDSVTRARPPRPEPRLLHGGGRR